MILHERAPSVSVHGHADPAAVVDGSADGEEFHAFGHIRAPVGDKEGDARVAGLAQRGVERRLEIVRAQARRPTGDRRQQGFETVSGVERGTGGVGFDQPPIRLRGGARQGVQPG